MKLSIRIVAPDAWSFEEPRGTWVGVGLARAEPRGDPLRWGTEQMARVRRGVLIWLPKEGPVVAWRGLFSSHDCFWVEGAEGLLLTDHFAHGVAAVPVAERRQSYDSVVAHYLTRMNHFGLTHLDRVAVLGHGERLVHDGRRASLEVFDRLEPAVVPGDRADYLDRVEAALCAACETLGGASVMFSGGVDSTLVASCMPEGTDAVTFVPGSPEYRIETEYARRAASILGLPVTYHEIPEEGYLELLEATIDVCGQPPVHDAMPMFYATFRDTPRDGYVVAEGADSLFGYTMLSTVVGWRLRRRPFPRLLGLLARVGGDVGARLGRLAGAAEALGRPVDDPEGPVVSSEVFGDGAKVLGLLDPVERTELVRHVFDYVGARVSLPQGRDFAAVVETMHWTYLFEDELRIDLHLAGANGKRLASPFLDPATVDALASIPSPDRYVRGLRGKWILKDVLARRVPGYPVDQRKQSTALPFARFYRSGPLSQIWDRYEVPDVFDGALRDDIVEGGGGLTWNAITHAIWMERVVRNPDYRPPAARLLVDRS
ncbi:MAG TPA: asparagine synthase [Actinobacteria bacterium]|nr:asparagine synthase [Actinomycetota bacterium]